MSRFKWLKRFAATAAALALCAMPVLGEGAKAEYNGKTFHGDHGYAQFYIPLTDIPDYFVARNRTIRSKL